MNNLRRMSFCSVIFCLFCLSSCTDKSCSDSSETGAVECTTPDSPPDGCNTNKPASGTLRIETSWKKNDPAYTLYIFKGNIEDNHKILISQLSDEIYEKVLPLGEYSAAVKYQVSGNPVVVLDGGKLKTDDDEECKDGCTFTCWDSPYKALNLRLK